MLYRFESYLASFCSDKKKKECAVFTCPYCRQTVVAKDHYCTAKNGYVDSSDPTGDFLTSALIAGVTDNAIVGGLIGGDMLGGLVGDLFSDGDLF